MSQQARGEALIHASFPSLSSFYLDNRRRVGSREVDIGLWWRQGSDGPLHRAAWVRDTGELYLVHLGPPDVGGGKVELLATVADQDRLEQALAGWRDECGKADSLEWLRRRCAQLGTRARRIHTRLAAADQVTVVTRVAQAA
jgi:hypothetical protein